jgi:hypothetical protein
VGDTIQDGIKNAVARRTLKDIVISDRQQITGEFMKDASEKLLKLGILLVDVRMQRIALQEEVASSVYDSMKRTFEGIAQTQRGEGSREAQIVKSEAERRRTEIIATSLADAQRIRGEGDAAAASIYATAYNRNPEFYSFYRSLQAYRSALGRDGDVMVISPESDFFRYLKSPAPPTGADRLLHCNSRIAAFGRRRVITGNHGQIRHHHRDPVGRRGQGQRSSTCSPSVPRRWHVFRAGTTRATRWSSAARRPCCRSFRRESSTRTCNASSATAWCCRWKRCSVKAQTLIDTGVDVFARLRVSPNCPLILPSHVSLDKAREAARGANAIGTTGRGIGPAYEDKVARRAVRVQDLFQREKFAAKLGEILDFHNFVLQHYFKQPAVDFQKTLDEQLSYAERVRPLVCDSHADSGGLAREKGRRHVRGRPGRHARRRSRHLTRSSLRRTPPVVSPGPAPASDRVRSTMCSAS